MAYRILVTGSRDWPQETVVWSALTAHIGAAHTRDVTIVHGACPTGADLFAHMYLPAMTMWWRTQGVHLVEEQHPAQWSHFGRSAGFLRNSAMVMAGADLCLAFHYRDSRGTAHCAGLAEKAGIPTERYTHD